MIGTIAGWRTYAADRGNTAPTSASDADATAALVRASDYITYHYVQNFTVAVDDATVEAATYEAANLELATAGFFSQTYTPDQRKVLTGVKGITWTVVGGAKGADAAMPQSTLIEAMLGKYTGRNVGLGMRSVGP